MVSPLTLVCFLCVGLEWRPRGMPGMRSLCRDFAQSLRGRLREVHLQVPCCQVPGVAGAALLGRTLRGWGRRVL